MNYKYIAKHTKIFDFKYLFNNINNKKLHKTMYLIN